jgi:hypothetical protein
MQYCRRLRYGEKTCGIGGESFYGETYVVLEENLCAEKRDRLLMGSK